MKSSTAPATQLSPIRYLLLPGVEKRLALTKGRSIRRVDRRDWRSGVFTVRIFAPTCAILHDIVRQGSLPLTCDRLWALIQQPDAIAMFYGILLWRIVKGFPPGVGGRGNVVVGAFFLWIGATRIARIAFYTVFGDWAPSGLGFTSQK
jgi:hypothetical protein